MKYKFLLLSVLSGVLLWLGWPTFSSTYLLFFGFAPLLYIDFELERLNPLANPRVIGFGLPVLEAEAIDGVEGFVVNDPNIQEGSRGIGHVSGTAGFGCSGSRRSSKRLYAGNCRALASLQPRGVHSRSG